MDGRDLSKCECFIDLALAETKERVNQILVAAMSDWTGLARFRPRSPGQLRSPAPVVLALDVGTQASRAPNRSVPLPRFQDAMP
jgi:hypothetical protein